MNKRKLLYTLRLTPIALAFIAFILWGYLGGHPARAASAAHRWDKDPSPQNGCSTIETYVSDILQLFGATAGYEGCSNAATSMITGTSTGTATGTTSGISTGTSAGITAGTSTGTSAGTTSGTSTGTATTTTTTTTSSGTTTTTTTTTTTPSTSTSDTSTSTSQSTCQDGLADKVEHYLSGILGIFGVTAEYNGCK